jgi:hypothetical protein
MKIKIPVLIIGAGYSGLILQNRLNLSDINSIIVERGYKHGYNDDDYVTICKSKFPFANNEIKVITNKISSKSLNFNIEFAEKVYNRKIQVSTFYEDQRDVISFKIDNEYLLDSTKCYGNIEITNIDIKSKKAFGKVLHLGKDVEFSYDYLISTIPLYEFQKLVNANFLSEFNVFISYYPIGIKKRKSEQYSEDMIIEYYSDVNIPFYRKQIYGNTVFYEYCLNKPYSEKFDAIIRPGKFTKVKGIENLYVFFNKNQIFFAGRFATWDPDFLLDNIWNPNDSCSNKQLEFFYNEVM